MTHERTTIRNVPYEPWHQLRVLAAKRDTTVSKLVIEAIEDFLGNDK